MKYFIALLFIVPTIIFFPDVSFAREPLASELVTVTATLSSVNVNYSARATSSDPFYITDIIAHSVDTAGGLVRVFCGTTLIFGYVATSPTERDFDFITTPYECNGAVWATQDFGVSSTKLSSVLFVGYSMTDTNFDEQPSSGGGGGGSEYIIDVGSTVMLGGLLAFFIAYWFVGLIRHRKTWNS